jgi:hydroxyethylthiazole kinase
VAAEPTHFTTSAAAALQRLRTRAPRVHCITNTVAQAFTANVLLAVGAIPSMTVAPEEVPDFTAMADALLINLGTLDPTRRSAALAAIEVAKEGGRPWVLDPVFADISRPRLAFARELVRHEPTVLRLNAAEFVALAGRDPTVQGVAACALETLSIVALTGPTDLVTDGLRHALIENGHPLMAKVTAMGCASSAVAASFLAVEHDRMAAIVAGLVVMGVAGERAAAAARGPGSFAVAMLDALAALSPEDVAGSARIR